MDLDQSITNHHKSLQTELHWANPLITNHFNATNSSLSKSLPFKSKNNEFNDITQVLLAHIKPHEKNGGDKDNTGRLMIIDKIESTLWKLGSSKEIYFYAIGYMDLIIENHSKSHKSLIRLEEAALGSIFLSLKFHQKLIHMPPLKAIQMLFDPNYYYSNIRLRQIELFCLKLINYDCSLVTPYMTLELIISKGIISSSDMLKESYKLTHLKIITYAREIMRKIVKKSNEYCKYNQLLLALSIICFVRSKKNLEQWDKTFEQHYSIMKHDLQVTDDFIIRILVDKKKQVRTMTQKQVYSSIPKKDNKKGKMNVENQFKGEEITYKYASDVIKTSSKKKRRSISVLLGRTNISNSKEIKHIKPFGNTSYRSWSMNPKQEKNKESSQLRKGVILLRGESFQIQKGSRYTKSISNSRINNTEKPARESLLLNQSLPNTNSHPKIKLDKIQERKIKIHHYQINKKITLNKLIFNNELRRIMNTSRDKSIHKGHNKNAQGKLIKKINTKNNNGSLAQKTYNNKFGYSFELINITQRSHKRS